MPCIWHDLITLAVIYLLSASRSYSLFMLSVLFIVFMVSIEPRFRTCWCLYCLYSNSIVYRQGIDRSGLSMGHTHIHVLLHWDRARKETRRSKKNMDSLPFESHFQRYEKQKWESEPPHTHRPVWDKVSKVKSKVSRDWIFSTLKQATIPDKIVATSPLPPIQCWSTLSSGRNSLVGLLIAEPTLNRGEGGEK